MNEKVENRMIIFGYESISELVVFPHRFLDVPSATHTLRKDNEIAFAECYRFAVVVRYCYFTVENQAGFFDIVVPGEC